MRRLRVFAGSLLAVAASVGPVVGDDFEAQHKAILARPLQETGKEGRVRAHVQLIEAHPDDPRLSEVLLDLQGLIGGKEEARYAPIVGMTRLAMIERAADLHAPGSPMRIKAQFFMLSLPSRTEKELTLRRIESEASDDVLAMARVEHERLRLAREDGDLAKVERHAERLLNWYDTPSNVPRGLEKHWLDSTINSAGSTLISVYSTLDIPIAERRAKINSLLRRYPWNDALKLSALTRE